MAWLESPGDSASPPHSRSLPACAATAVGSPRSIGSAMNRPMSSARPVTTPSTPASSAAMIGSGPISATIRAASSTSDAVERADGAGRPARGDRRASRGVDSRTATAPTGPRRRPGSSPRRRTSASNARRQLVEVGVRAGDAEREHERHAVADRGAHVRPYVRRLVRRHLLARAEPVRPPVAAGALRHHDVDAPGEGPLDGLLDVGRRRDVVDETEDPHRVGHDPSVRSRSSTISRRRSLPVAVRGSFSTIRTARGRL